MKKINKSQPPNALTVYENQHPNSNWDPDFRNYNAGNDYRAIKGLLLEDQGGLCGYCERNIKTQPIHKQRIEHFHSKSDSSNPTKNWALDWQNIFAVCVGGDDAQKSIHPLPINLSCDSHKNHLISKQKLALACEGLFLNPQDIIARPRLFHFEKSSGALSVNKEACADFNYLEHQYGSVEELVQKTISILNLNCQRLCDDRLEILKSYNQEVAKARRVNDRQGFEKLARRWFSDKWPSFFTTRRILLDQHAEVFLEQIAFNG